MDFCFFDVIELQQTSNAFRGMQSSMRNMLEKRLLDQRGELMKKKKQGFTITSSLQ